MNATLAHIIRLCLGHFATPELPLPPAQPTTRKERRRAQREAPQIQRFEAFKNEQKRIAALRKNNKKV